MTKYTYEKLCDPERLEQEIAESAIITAIDHIETVSAPETTDVWFKAELSVEDEAILDALVAAHVNEPLPEDVIQVVSLDQPKDSDGAPLSRNKITATGWGYQLHGLEFKTSQLDSLYSKKKDGTDFGFSTIKLFKDSGGSLVECVDQADADVNCIATQVEWEPTHDYEVIGGMLKMITVPTENVRVWVTGVPDVPEVYGGSKPFVVSVNLKFIGIEEGVKVDGRAPKYLTYSVNHTNKLQLFFRHPAGFKHDLHMIFEIFKA